MTVYFNEEEVRKLLPMKDAVDAVDEALRCLSEGTAVNRPRTRSRAGRRMLHVMSAASEALGYLGLKAYSTGPGGARFYVLLFSADSGELVSLLSADALGQIRTGAASGVATRYMAREDANRVGIIGTGWQARSQLEAVAHVRRLDAVIAYSRGEENRKKYCDEMSEVIGVTVEPVDRPERIGDECDIVIVSTNSREPVLFGKWLRPGQHVNAIGSNAVGRIEIDAEAVTRSDFVATDSVEQAKIECGDLLEVIEQGKLSWSDVHELSDVVAGKVQARTGPDAITLFESQGLAIEDVAVAKRIYERGQAEGVGTKLSM